MTSSPPFNNEPDFSAIFQASPTPYLILTPDLNIAAVNDAYLKATCRVREDLIGRHVFDAFPDNPDDPAANGVENLRNSLERVLERKAHDTMAMQKYDIPIAEPPPGRFEERYWAPVNAPVLDANGNLVYIIHRVEDVTEFAKALSRAEVSESKVAAQALEIQAANQRIYRSKLEVIEAARKTELEHQRLTAVVDSAPVGIFVVDANGILIHTNDANRRFWGKAQPHLNDSINLVNWKGWWADGTARHGQPIAAQEWPLARALKGEEIPYEIIEVESFDEPPERRNILASAAPVRDVAGSIIGAVVTAMDISDRVKAEQALRDADRRKDEFLAMLAHELRNPLAPISAAADLLAMGGMDEERIRQTSAVIARQVRHMTGLVDDLLDVSRVTRGLVKLDKIRLDAKHIIYDAVEQIRPLIEARRHHLALRIMREPAYILGDSKRLVQIIANLLNNAAKYTPESGEIVVGLEADDGGVLVSVQDNGIGMRSEMLDRVFELFAQAERTADRSQGGLGIGLALVKSLVEMHGGRGWATSKGIGQGSTFAVWLPRLETPGQSGDPNQNGTAISLAKKPLKIMVVDDNVDAAQMLSMVVETLGYQVIVEHNSRRTLERALVELPEVYLLDIGLPDIDGYELARRLRGQPETAKAVLVGVTGYGQDQDRETAFSAGFDHHLIKPVDIAKLSVLLSRIAEK